MSAKAVVPVGSKFQYFNATQPAGGTIAAFDFAERRHVPLAAPQGSYNVSLMTCSELCRLMSLWGHAGRRLSRQLPGV